MPGYSTTPPQPGQSRRPRIRRSSRLQVHRTEEQLAQIRTAPAEHLLLATGAASGSTRHVVRGAAPLLGEHRGRGHIDARPAPIRRGRSGVRPRAVSVIGRGEEALHGEKQQCGGGEGAAAGQDGGGGIHATEPGQDAGADGEAAGGGKDAGEPEQAQLWRGSFTHGGAFLDAPPDGERTASTEDTARPRTVERNPSRAVVLGRTT